MNRLSIARAIGGPLTYVSKRSPDFVTRVLLHLHRPIVGSNWIPLEIEGIRLLVNPQDNCGGKLYYWGSYEPEQTSAIRKLIAETAPGTFLDIGANIGYYSILAAKLGVGRVIAIEASPQIFSKLARSVELNPILKDRFELLNVAVSDKIGTASFWANEDPHNFGLGSILTAAGGGADAVVVAAITVDSLPRASEPLLCKIDVEGAEFGVLQGMRDTIRRSAPTFLLEIHPKELRSQGASVIDVLDLLWEEGYTIRLGYDNVVLGRSNLPEGNFWVIARKSI